MLLLAVGRTGQRPLCEAPDSLGGRRPALPGQGVEHSAVVLALHELLAGLDLQEPGNLLVARTHVRAVHDAAARDTLRNDDVPMPVSASGIPLLLMLDDHGVPDIETEFSGQLPHGRQGDLAVCELRGRNLEVPDGVSVANGSGVPESLLHHLGRACEHVDGLVVWTREHMAAELSGTGSRGDARSLQDHRGILRRTSPRALSVPR